MGVKIVVAIVVLYVLVAGGVSFCLWDFFSKGAPSISNSVTTRNLVLMWGTPLAIFLAVWRSVVAQRQVEAAQAGLLSNRYQRAVEMLGHDKTSIRIGGIHALLNLAIEHPDEYQQEVLGLLKSHEMNSDALKLGNEGRAVGAAVIELSAHATPSSLTLPDHWGRRLLPWFKNLCKRS